MSTSLEKIQAEIEKKYYKGAFGLLSARPDVTGVEVVPTGIPSLDAAIGIGGIPRGRIVTLYGKQSGGKSTLAATIIASAQRLGAQAGYWDAEYTLDKSYFQSLGVDIDNLYICQPDHGEMGIDMMDMVLQEDGSGLDIIVVDSISSMVPKAELDGEITDANIGLQARMVSKAMRMLTGKISKSKAIVIFIAQVRDNLNITYGSQHSVITSGKSLLFYSSLMLEVNRIGAVKQGEDVIGNAVKIKVTKNKVAPPFKEVEVQMIFGTGFDADMDLAELLISNKLIKKAGSWYKTLDDVSIGQGRDSVKQWINEYGKDKLIDEVKEKMGLKFAATAVYNNKE